MNKSLKQQLIAHGLVLPAFLVVMLTVAYPIVAKLSVIMFLICSVSAGVYIYTNLKENDWKK